MTLLFQLQKEMKLLTDSKRAEVSQRYFKTGKGEYGEGDIFLGIPMPGLRKLAKEYKDLLEPDLQILIESKIHEDRTMALLILLGQYTRSKDSNLQKQKYIFYTKNMQYINNWDLVDISAPKIVGHYLFNRERKFLYKWAVSKHLWTRRVAIIATFYFIRQNDFSDTLKISELLLNDREDLIHKAVGWMLREVGKRDLVAEEKFLLSHYKNMPRVMLRYAIEKMPEKRRKAYLNGKVYG